MNKLFVSLLLIILSSTVFAQEKIMEVNVVKDTVESTKGPNKKHFSHVYLGVGFAAMAPEGDSLAINYGKSNEFTFGYRYKRKFSNISAVGYDLYYTIRNSDIKQEPAKKFFTSVPHTKEKFVQRTINALVYTRINFGKRGNRIGRFIDLAGFFEWPFSSTVVTRDKLSATEFKRVKAVFSNLTFVSPYNYGVSARIGLNRFVFYGTYRLSDVFKAKFGYAELPRLNVGLQIGIHK